MPSKRPSFQFYPGDWIRDSVAGCSLDAQGLWLRMMIVAHDSDRYGYLEQNGAPMPPDAIARRCGCESVEQYSHLLSELREAGVPSRTDEGVIFSRRMVRDESLREVRASGGSESLNNPNVARPKSQGGAKDGGKDTDKDGPEDTAKDGAKDGSETGSGEPAQPSFDVSLGVSPSSSSSSSKSKPSCTASSKNDGAAREKSLSEKSGVRLAALLRSEILRNKPDAKITPGQFEKWATTADRMIRLDGRREDRIEAVIRWAQSDTFWISNALSMDTFREKFDQLELKALASQKTPAPFKDDDFLDARVRKQREASQ